jgi:hypothetical protein
LLVHIGDPSSNQATTLESQIILMIQELFGQTLRNLLSRSARRRSEKIGTLALQFHTRKV